MSSTGRKERRHLWWKQHGQQVGDQHINKEEGNQKKFKATSFKKSVKKEQSKISVVAPPIQSEGNKARFIVFIGNLPFDLTKEDVIHHFRCTGGVTDFRLMTKKDGGASKGCGFLELDNFVCYEKALNLHHSVIGGRKINVEVTCGGGGSGEKRLEKIDAKKKKFRKKRGKKMKVKTEENAESKNNPNVGNNQDKDIQNNTEKLTSCDSVIVKKRKIKEEGSPNEEKTSEEMSTRKQNADRNKKQKRKHEPSEENEKKKKSLSESSAMESIVKDLELDSLVTVVKKKINKPEHGTDQIQTLKIKQKSDGKQNAKKEKKRKRKHEP